MATPKHFKFQKTTDAENLYYSRGAALNISTYRFLETSGRFKREYSFNLLQIIPGWHLEAA